MSTVQGGCTRARRRRRAHALPRRKTVRWSSAEVDGLLEGVREHGVGKWAAILRSSPCFNPVRTSVDLKDKWRNLAAHVRALALQSIPTTATTPLSVNVNISALPPTSSASSIPINVSSPPRRPRSDININLSDPVSAATIGLHATNGNSAVVSSMVPGATLSHNITGIAANTTSSPLPIVSVSSGLSRPILIPKGENPLEPLHPPPNTTLQHVSSLAPLAPHPIVVGSHPASHAPPPPFVNNGRHVYTTRVLAPLPVGLGTTTHHQGNHNNTSTSTMSHLAPHDDGSAHNNVGVHHHMNLHNTELPLNSYFGGDFTSSGATPGNTTTATSNNHNHSNAGLHHGRMSAGLPTGSAPMPNITNINNGVSDHLRHVHHNVAAHHNSNNNSNPANGNSIPHHGVQVPHNTAVGVQHQLQPHNTTHTHHDAVPQAAGSVNDAAGGGSLSFDPFPEPGDL